MANKIKDRKIVVVNQAVNYLTIGIANSFATQFERVDLIAGSVHMQGEELDPAISIHSINKWVERPAKKKFMSYIIATLKIAWLLNTKYRRHEVFFVSIPPMGYLINLITFQRFSMLIWDVYPDAFKITGMKESHPMYRIWAWLNKRSFKKAFRLYTIGERMADLVAQYVKRDKLLITPIWSIFQENRKVAKNENIFIKEHGLEGKFIVQYSGNIGLTHKVELMVEIAERLIDEKNILFQIIGRGPRVPHLQKLVAEKQLSNCQFLPFQSDEMFPYSLSAADIGVVILDAVTSKGSVPSKTYNLMSYGIPMLSIASEDSELFHYSQIYKNGRCFSEEHLDDACAFLKEISTNTEMCQEMSVNASEAAKNYRRSNADKIVELYIQEPNQA